MPTTSFSRHPGPMSPPPSTSSQAFTISQQPKINVVTRLAIEGKAKQGQDGASIKMYLKISLPLEAVSPGTTLPLFPEENVKILTSQVHPIDGNSVPYNFSSTTCPLLHNAARALNLPARSSISYLSNFGLSHPSPSSTGSSSRSISSNGINPPPLDDKYTGHILVSGYNVSYVLPKQFPRFKGNSLTDNEEEGSNRPTPFRGKRASVTEKNAIQFMAAIDMWVPHLSRPPRAPYLLSIPTPRCLSNHVRLRIFPPTPTTASFASLSSAEEDGGTWDLTSDPHVTRSTSTRLSRTSSYSNFADDESSESSTAGFSDGCGIQGTFPSAERLRVRWAPPLKTVDVPNGGDGRRRVGVREAKAEMTCVVLGKGKNKNNGTEGVVMNIEYKGTCKGVWFPGVATLLGMDVGLESKGSDVTWISESEPKWSVGGGLGYTGFDMGVSPHPISKQSSTDSGPQIFILPSSPAAPGLGSRQNSTSSTSSLLRAPLPTPNVPDFSFEGSATSSAPSGTISSIGSLPPSSTPNIERKSSSASINGVHSDAQDPPPGLPITIHINMNDLLPPSKNIFTFTISGTILITPRSRSYNFNLQNSSPAQSDSETDPEPIVLPRFSVLAADAETTSFLIRNEVAQATVEVYNSSGDIRDAQTRKTVLQKGGFTRCSSDGGRIALRTFRPTLGSHQLPPNDNVVETARLPPSGARPSKRALSPSPLRPVHSMPLKPRRDGRLMIPSVVATVTPWLNSSPNSHNVYAVRLYLPAPCDAGSEWLEFGFAQRSSHPSVNSLDTAAGDCKGKPPQLHLASVSVDGVPVRFETSTTAKQDLDGLTVPGLPFEEMGQKQWVSWVKVNIAGRGGGNVLVDYIVTDRGRDVPKGNARKGKGKARDENPLNILLPTFSLPVGRLEVIVETNSEIEILSLQSNLTHQYLGRRLLKFCTEELFHPWLSLSLRLSSRSREVNHSVPVSITNSLGIVTRTAPALLSLVLLFCLIGLGTEIRQMKRTLETCSTVVGSAWDEAPEVVTVTTTALLHPSSHSKWWFGETSLIDSLTIITSSSSPSATPTISADFLGSRWSSAFQSEATTSASAQTNSNAELTSIIGGENQSLVLFDVIPFPWLLPFELPPPVQAAVDKILEGLGIIWVVVKRVYHYPLEPPP